ncbi:MAG: sugar transferase [Bacteroidota bacterium]
MTYTLTQTPDFHYYQTAYRLSKRLFDIVVAGTLLLILSPLLALVALLIRLESKGSVFYASKRVGEGYRVFDFYKFRSMRTDADRLLEKMKAQNQYGNASAAASNEVNSPASPTAYHLSKGETFLVGNEGVINETDWLAQLKSEEAGTFVKFKNDPRITRIGKFIRNSSMDELPQLINVLKGDMSLVGNRPLPLYEAEKLTSDEAVGRFLAPAGITGLWQVTERGKANAASGSRKRLDVEYARNCSMWLDLTILFRTPFAAFQQESV